MKYRLILSLLLVSVFSFSQPYKENSFSHDQLAGDLSYMVKMIEEVHPNPFHSISKSRFDVLTDSISKTFKDGMSVQDAWAGFALVMASLNEGHSSIEYPPTMVKQIRSDSELLFPILIRDFADEKLVVRYDLSEDSVLHTGDYITRINGRSAAELMKSLSSFYGGLSNWRNLQVIGDFAGTLLLHKIYAPYTIEFIHNNEKQEITLKGIHFSQLMAKIAQIKKQNTTPQVQVSNYSFSRTENNAGYINFRSMKDLNAFTKFLDSVFTDIKNNSIQGLIIDLRQNGGGNSALGEKLLSFITDKKFRMGGGSSWKVSDAYKQFIKDQSSKNPAYTTESFKSYLNNTSDTIISQGGGRPYSTGKNPLRYDGKVCVLTGPYTFSSANMLANAIKDYQLATIIGEATGEAPNDFGELYWSKLPNTQLTFYTCTKQFIRANGDTADNNPVLPDIEKRNSYNSLKDEVLEFAKEWLQKK